MLCVWMLQRGHSDLLIVRVELFTMSGCKVFRHGGNVW